MLTVPVEGGIFIDIPSCCINGPWFLPFHVKNCSICQSTCTVYIHADTMWSCWLPSDWLYVPLRPSSIFCTASNWRVSSSRASLQVKIIFYQSSFVPWSYKHIFIMDFYVCNNFPPYALLDKPKPKQCWICRLFRSI